MLDGCCSNLKVMIAKSKVAHACAATFALIFWGKVVKDGCFDTTVDDGGFFVDEI